MQKCTFIMKTKNIVKTIVGIFALLLLVQCGETKVVKAKIETSTIEKNVETEFGKDVSVGDILSQISSLNTANEEILVAFISDNGIVLNSKYYTGTYTGYYCIPYTISIGSTAWIYSEYYKNIRVEVLSTDTKKGTVNLKVNFGEENK